MDEAEVCCFPYFILCICTREEVAQGRSDALELGCAVLEPCRDEISKGVSGEIETSCRILIFKKKELEEETGLNSRLNVPSAMKNPNFFLCAAALQQENINVKDTHDTNKGKR